MKRGLSILFLLIILSSFLVLAANATDLGNVTGKVSDFKERTNTALESNVEIPESLETIVRIFLGIRAEEPISRLLFIVLIVTFIFFFFLMKEVVVLIPFFEEGWQNWLGAFIVTSLVGLSRGLLVFASFFMDLGLLLRWISGSLGWVFENLFLRLFIPIVAIITIWFLFKYIVQEIRYKIRPKLAYARGYKEGVWDKMASRMMKLFGKVPAETSQS